MIRVLLADDHHVVRMAVATLLEQEPDLCVVGQASNGNQLLELLEHQQADIVLVDARMPGGPRVTDLVSTIRRAYPLMAILIFSAYNRREYVLGVLKKGAAGYVLKDDAPGMLVDAIRQVVLEGQPYISPRVVSVLASAMHSEEIDPLEQLSPREYDVLSLMPYGLTNDQIATQLNLEKQTIKNYVSSLFRKLGISSRLEAALFAYRHGVADPDAPPLFMPEE